MDRKIIALNMKYFKCIPIFGLLLAISLFLPFISIKEQAITVSAAAILIKAVKASSTFGSNIMLAILILLTGLSAILSLIAVLSAGINKSKATVIFAIFTYIFSTLSAFAILFSITPTLNASGLLPVSFLIRYLGAGYWLFLISGICGLVTSMLTAKKSPGYIVLSVLSVIWLIPLAWIIMISFRAESGSYTSYFFPKSLTLKNYVSLLTDNSQFYYLRWFGNTLFVAVCSCLLSTLIVLSSAYTLSRMRFQGRRLFMNVLLILGMFPGFMSMIAVYYILKGIGISQSLLALIMVYSGGASMGYYVAKGFFDTIPKSLDEAAFMDGATRWFIFTKITIPLSKPIIMYTMLISFMAPWADYIFASIIMGDNYENYTLALGLSLMLDRANIAKWYTRFAAGAVLVSIPIAILFISLQKYYTSSLSGSVKG